MEENSSNILIIDNDEDILNLLKLTLTNAGYNIFCATNTSYGYDILKTKTIRLIILDQFLDEETGSHWCSKIKEHSNFSSIPIIFISNDSSDKQKEVIFESGADDYLKKPLNLKELQLRIKTRLNTFSNKIRRANLILNHNRMEAYCETQENSLQAISLTTSEYRVLYFLCHNMDRDISRKSIIDIIWGESFAISERTVDQHISRLRKKILNCNLELQSVRGMGYKMTFKNNF